MTEKGRQLSPKTKASSGHSTDELVGCIIDNNLVSYLLDTDVADQIVEWIHDEVGIRKIYARTALRILTAMVVKRSGRVTSWSKSLLLQRCERLLERVPGYTRLCDWLLSQGRQLDSRIADRHLVDDILAGKRPPHDLEYGKRLSQGLQASLRTLSEIEDIDERLRVEFEGLRRLLQPQPPLNLHLFPVSDSSRLHYAAQRVPFIGREEELLRLRSFLDCDASFKWWMTTGPAGVGKSRLALELCLRNGTGWRVGFLPEDHAFDNWYDWEPDCPTLMIADYLPARTGDIQRLVVALQSRSAPVEWPVRLLVLERAPMGATIENFRGSGTRRLAIGLAEYDRPLVLGPMSRDQIGEVFAAIVDESQNAHAVDKYEVLASLEKIDPQKRPLFAVLAAEAVAAGRDIRQWDRDTLLNDILKREQERFWQPAQVTETEKNLLSLVTMTRGIPLEALSSIDEPAFLPSISGESAPAFDIRNYARICGGDVSNCLDPLSPDILGEFFVLEHLRSAHALDTHRVATARDLAWRLRPESFFGFLLRATADFPDHETLRHLTVQPPEGEAQRFYWSAFLANRMCRSVENGNLSGCRADFERLCALVRTYPTDKSLLLTLAAGTFHLLLGLRDAETGEVTYVYESLKLLDTSGDGGSALPDLLSKGAIRVLEEHVSQGNIASAHQVFAEVVALVRSEPTRPVPLESLAQCALVLLAEHSRVGDEAAVRRVFATIRTLDGEIEMKQPPSELVIRCAVDHLHEWISGSPVRKPESGYSELFATMAGHPEQADLVLKGFKSLEERADSISYDDIVLNKAPVGICLLDRDLRVLTFNDAAESVLRGPEAKWSARLLVDEQRSFLDIVPRSDLRWWKDTLGSVLSTGKPHSKERYFATVGGRELVLVVKVSLLKGESEGANRLLIVIEEITEKVILEKYVVLSEKMVAKGEMAASIGHELNNHLELLSAYSELLPLYVGRGHLDKLSESCTRIQDSIDAMARFIRGLMDYSQVETELIEYDLRVLIQEHLFTIRPLRTFRNVQFNILFDPHLPLVLLDVGQIQSVLLNLYINAIDAAEAKRPTRITVECRAQEQEGTIELSVADNGCGIPEAMFPKLFAAGVTTKPHGHGLGLANCKTIVTNHGGTIEAEAHRDHGAKFVIKLPCLPRLSGGDREAR